eukprot:COSAG06_NODE_4629_length_4086_cov_2.385754_3_plen_40_part_01
MWLSVACCGGRAVPVAASGKSTPPCSCGGDCGGDGSSGPP